MHSSEYDAAMSLQTKINLIFALVSVLVLSLLVAVQIQASRSSVREEIGASNRIATQLLGRITLLYSMRGLDHLAGFLKETGRVRANEVTLRDNAAHILYASPPSTYKQGRDAPQWYAALVTPELKPQTILLQGGTLLITPNPTRAVLDAWDELREIFLGEAVLLLVANLFIFLIIRRWLAPFDLIRSALRAIERGQHQVRLAPLAGKEAGEIGRAFNHMAQSVEESIQVRHASAEAQARLAAQREFTGVLHQRIEEERTALARELHDELGQSLTAIRSIAKSIMQSPEIKGRPPERSVQMLFDTAGLTADALHRMIPRLRPIQLEGMGLVDAVRDLVADIQLRHPTLKIDMTFDAYMPALPDALEISAYRIVQEALTNVVRHAGATQVMIGLCLQNESLCMRIADNGGGASVTLVRAGHFGVRGMRERAESMAGSILFRTSAEGGLEVDVTLPVKKVAG
ncbi:MAG: HAMP domain-containing protein [Herminiimonas sp.]|nr:HAMP domain-containing protein [Herminiimonas sp.]